MSDIIHLLPDSVANQIAAGEVIQRPASVIKELVENAIDAGARNIHVRVMDSGRTTIQVIDDGKGMSETDARMAFERHATSKIANADDLFRLNTMGFRGEALASIAAVAQVELKSRTPQSDIGTRLSIAGCKVLSQSPESCPVGSSFKVENLFYNVPARRKFLKSNATELSNIMTALERIVLVYPEIAFTFHNNDVELLNLRAATLKQRIVDVFGKKLSQELLTIKVDTSLCTINGFVGKPEAARKRGAHEYFFVNGRFMKHPYFHKAVLNAFERLIPQGSLVPYFIYFEVPTADIDVNIHPTKTEIKFENEQAIWQILMAAVKDAIGSFCNLDAIDFDTEGKPDIPLFDGVQQVEIPTISVNSTYNPFKQYSEQRTQPKTWQPLYNGLETRKGHQSGEEPEGEWENTEELADQNSPLQASFFEDVPLTPPSVEDTGVADSDLADKSPTHYQYKGRFIMTAVKSGLMVIDQERADIRIKYEQYIDRRHPHATQRLLFPEVAHLSPSDGVMLQKILPELTNMGFELSDLGQNSYGISGIPAGAEGIQPVQLLESMVHDVVETGKNNMEDIIHHLALNMAKSTCVVEGQVLSDAEMDNIINRLFACTNVNYTPDGHKIIHILSHRDIEKCFDT